MQFLTISKAEHTITDLPTWYYNYAHHFNQKTCKLLHYWHHNKCMFIVTYFIAVCFKEMLVLPPRKLVPKHVALYAYIIDQCICWYNTSYLLRYNARNKQRKREVMTLKNTQHQQVLNFLLFG